VALQCTLQISADNQGPLPLTFGAGSDRRRQHSPARAAVMLAPTWGETIVMEEIHPYQSLKTLWDKEGK